MWCSKPVRLRCGHELSAAPARPYCRSTILKERIGDSAGIKASGRIVEAFESCPAGGAT